MSDHKPISPVDMRSSDSYTDLETAVFDLAKDLTRLDQATDAQDTSNVLRDLLANAGLLTEAVEELLIACSPGDALDDATLDPCGL